MYKNHTEEAKTNYNDISYPTVAKTQNNVKMFDGEYETSKWI